LRRLTSRRTQLIRQRTRIKNEISAVLVRNLKGRPPVSDLFGKKGRAWLAGLVAARGSTTTANQGQIKSSTTVSGQIPRWVGGYRPVPRSRGRR
jgi:transposase